MKTQAELEAMVRRACGHEHHSLDCVCKDMLKLALTVRDDALEAVLELESLNSGQRRAIRALKVTP